MIKHIWSILCERIVTDQETNSISYLTCLESITADKFPAKIPLIAHGALWGRSGTSDEELYFRLTLIPPDGVKRTIIEASEVLKSEKHRTNIVLNGMPIPQAGQYIYGMEMKQDNKWVVVSETPFTVNVKDEAMAKVKGGSKERKTHAKGTKH